MPGLGKPWCEIRSQCETNPERGWERHRHGAGNGTATVDVPAEADHATAKITDKNVETQVQSQVQSIEHELAQP